MRRLGFRRVGVWESGSLGEVHGIRRVGVWEKVHGTEKLLDEKVLESGRCWDPTRMLA